MKTKAQFPKPLSASAKPHKHLARNNRVGSFYEPMAGERDQDYLPMHVPTSGLRTVLDFGRPGW